MSWLGVLLTMGGGIWGAALWCRSGRQRLRLGRELRCQMTVLRRGILTIRRPLGEMVGELADGGGETAYFWSTLEERMPLEVSFHDCWQKAGEVLPPPYGDMIAPLGSVLSLGEREAELLLEQTQEELTLYLRREEKPRATANRSRSL